MINGSGCFCYTIKIFNPVIYGLSSLFRLVQDLKAIDFQCWDVLLYHIPRDRMVHGSITVSHDIAHQFDLPPGYIGVLGFELVRQVPHQFSDLENTERPHCGRLDQK